MNGPALISFGFAWMVVAALLGLYLGVKHERHGQSLESAAAQGNLVEFHRILDAYKWRSSVHGHGMLFSLSAVAVGAIVPSTGLSPARTELLVATLIAATVVWTLAALKRIRVLMGLADLSFICAIALTAWSVANPMAAR